MGTVGIPEPINSPSLSRFNSILRSFLSAFPVKENDVARGEYGWIFSNPTGPTGLKTPRKPIFSPKVSLILRLVRYAG